MPHESRVTPLSVRLRSSTGGVVGIVEHSSPCFDEQRIGLEPHGDHFLQHLQSLGGNSAFEVFGGGLERTLKVFVHPAFVGIERAPFTGGFFGHALDPPKPSCASISCVTNDKNPFSGTILAVQPRIRMLRSFDQRNHTYQGYVLRIDDGASRDGGGLVVAFGEAAQKKHSFRCGDVVSGEGEPPEDDRTEVAILYKVSKLKVLQRSTLAETSGPPWHGVPSDLETYRVRGHRRLDARVFKGKCVSCIWGCEMAVEMTIDHWKPSKVRWRYETFCYGPRSCKLYRAGPTRKVPGRNGMSWEEEDWTDEQDTAHRGDDD
jgi:hypothetical protein